MKNDAANNFELAIDFLDLLERINQMKIMILNTFDAGKSHSLTNSGQCRLSALIPCINDSAKIFDLLSKTMKILHRALPWDTLSGHRQRFRSVYTLLGELYEKLNTFQYLRGIVQIPRLSGDISRFMKSLNRMEETATITETTQQSMVEEVDLAASEVNDLISVDDSLHASMAYIQEEYSDLSSKYQAALQMLQEERMYREGLQGDMLEKVEAYKNEIQVLQMNLLEAERCNQDNLEKFEASAKAAEVALATTNHNTADADKLEKLKAAYQKLRSDHITLIREKAETEKQLKESMEQKTSKNHEMFSIINNFLEKRDFLNNKSVFNVNQMKESFHELDVHIDTLLKTVQERDNTISQMESDKRLIEFNCSEKNVASKEELRNLQKIIPELESKLKISESERDSLKEAMTIETGQKSMLEEKCKQLEASLSEAEKLWRSKLMSQLQQLSKRLMITSRSKTQGSKSAIPQMKSIYDQSVIPNPKAILSSHTSNLQNTKCENNQKTLNGALQVTTTAIKSRLTNLCTIHDVLFYIMFTIMELLPYVNITENLQLTDLLTSACQLASLLQTEPDNMEKLEPVWDTFLLETETKLNSINGITEWDPTDEVDKEIYEMQVSDFY